MDVRSSRLSDHCRTRDDTEPARQGKRPFSGSDKNLEEYKQRAEPLLLSELCLCHTVWHRLTAPLPEVFGYMWMCVCLCTCVHTWMGDQNLPPSYLSNSCVCSIFLCGTTTVLNPNVSPIESNGSEGLWGWDLPGLIYGAANKSAWVPTLHCHHHRSSKIEPGWAKDRYN